MKDEVEELIFVYNADKDALNALIGYAHKVFSPSTYPCELCNLTHSNIGERRIWKDFRMSQHVTMSFIYKAEFNERFNITTNLPVVISILNGIETVVLTKEEMAALANANELMHAIRTKMQTKA